MYNVCQVYNTGCLPKVQPRMLYMHPNMPREITTMPDYVHTPSPHFPSPPHLLYTALSIGRWYFRATSMACVYIT